MQTKTTPPTMNRGVPLGRTDTGSFLFDIAAAVSDAQSHRTEEKDSEDANRRVEISFVNIKCTIPPILLYSSDTIDRGNRRENNRLQGVFTILSAGPVTAALFVHSTTGATLCPRLRSGGMNMDTAMGNVKADCIPKEDSGDGPPALATYEDHNDDHHN